MPALRHKVSQSTLNWVLTLLACAALFLPVLLAPLTARAELRAFRLKITNSETGNERRVITRFDHIQYPMYNHVAKTEVLEIEQTWMCVDRSDYLGRLCPAPSQDAANVSGGPGLPARRPASAVPAKR